MKSEGDLFGDDDDDTDEILLGIKDVGEEIGSGQGGKEIGPNENVDESDEPEPKRRKFDQA